MANTTFTNLSALEAVLNGETVIEGTPLYDKISAMLTAEQKKRDRAKNNKSTNSAAKRKTQLKRIEVMRAIVAGGNEPRTTQWIGEHVNDMMTAHKVAGVMNAARDEGWVIYGPKEKGKVTYQVTDAGIAFLDSVEQSKLQKGELLQEWGNSLYFCLTYERLFT